MITEKLEPRLALLREEYVLIQAWKKTASHIRYHNWYSDTLELDRAAVDLPRFLGQIAEKLNAPSEWNNDFLRIVPAPKSQAWWVNPISKLWEPVKEGKRGASLRPLAHVSLRDQVAATAVMLCLADRVETLQGDPRTPITHSDARKGIVSYGNRLFCDAIGTELHHRWGSAKLYRAYYQDYRTFLERPETVAESLAIGTGSRIYIVQSDLRQFYDRVSPAVLGQKLTALRRSDDDPNFFALAARLLNWTWNKKDSREVESYAKQAELSDFTRTGLPQGLVASGFFANVALLDFDQRLREAFPLEIAPGIVVEDVCRYVDDLRVVVTADSNTTLNDIEDLIAAWLQGLLTIHAQGLQLSEEKTKAAAFRGNERPLVQQSRKMARIQRAISGGFDAIAGEEILDAVQGLIRSQLRYSERRTDDQGWPFAPIPDVRDATVARFAAARFRTTYRSLRPLLTDRGDNQEKGNLNATGNSAVSSRIARTQDELDDETRAFAWGLVENWVEDPSNVRLLRIGLDLWPTRDILSSVLTLLKPFTEKGARRKSSRRVACYCLAEIFRAGATETGFVEELESLPKGVDIAAYRSVLREEAIRLASLPPSTLPWYLNQQVLLYLAATGTAQSPPLRIRRSAETRHYVELIRFLQGEGRVTESDFPTLAILSRRAFRAKETGLQLATRAITARRLEQIAQRDPSFAVEILASSPDLSEKISGRVRDDLCLTRKVASTGWISLADVVLRQGNTNPLRDELSIIGFASKFLEIRKRVQGSEAITPSCVLMKFRGEHTIAECDELKIVPSRIDPKKSMYYPPVWCSLDEHWRFQLGYLLRFILETQQDFTKIIRPLHWKENSTGYRAPEGHWYQRIYGFFNGHSAFGDDWVPISDWTERLLSALLRWPGCRAPEKFEWVDRGLEDTRSNIEARRRDLLRIQGPQGSPLILPIIAPRIIESPPSRPLRACVVQTRRAWDAGLDAERCKGT